MSDSDLEEILQMEYSQEIDQISNASQSEKRKKFVECHINYDSSSEDADEITASNITSSRRSGFTKRWPKTTKLDVIGGRYPTLSFIHPLMEVIKFKYAPNLDEDNYDNDKGFQEAFNFDSESDLSEEENDISVNIQENRSENNPEIIVKKIQIIIYNSLFEYWDYPSQICLLATLLDPRLRKMTFANDDVHNHTIEECHSQLRQLMPLSEEYPISSNPTNISSNNMFKNIIFGESQNSQESMDELDYYLDFRQTPAVSNDFDPLLWWKQQQSRFPNLSKLAQKYLGVPATSAPSERIFSDTRNHISLRRSNLKLRLVSQILFLKRNDNFINMFPNSHLYKQKKNRFLKKYLSHKILLA
ncbi:16909_t:CDS:2 [Racocetra fulgida]|uniref:16909_t:CDS:1 n=1 Tax=Racocetra fulgida TaxID=60492 RepID=A0A9N9EYJ4_9GLOM|nr:16909_t:CDS:2 [Racocetra fulgida]